MLSNVPRCLDLHFAIASKPHSSYSTYYPLSFNFGAKCEKEGAGGKWRMAMIAFQLRTPSSLSKKQWKPMKTMKLIKVPINRNRRQPMSIEKLQSTRPTPIPLSNASSLIYLSYPDSYNERWNRWMNGVKLIQIISITNRFPHSQWTRWSNHVNILWATSSRTALLSVQNV